MNRQEEKVRLPEMYKGRSDEGARENRRRSATLTDVACEVLRLQVHQRDVEAANSVLDEGPPDRFNVEGVGECPQPHCHPTPLPRTRVRKIPS